MVNRDELLNELAEAVIDGLDLDVVYTYAFEALRREMEQMTDNELVAEVQELYPHLLES